MAFSRIARPKAALALAGLVLGSIGAGEAHAQAFGVNGDATTDWAYIDFNGVHPGLRLDCVAGPSPWCGGGARSSTNGYSTASINTQQGFISGSVSAANVAPPLASAAPPPPTAAGGMNSPLMGAIWRRTRSWTFD